MMCGTAFLSRRISTALEARGFDMAGGGNARHLEKAQSGTPDRKGGPATNFARRRQRGSRRRSSSAQEGEEGRGRVEIGARPARLGSSTATSSTDCRRLQRAAAAVGARSACCAPHLRCSSAWLMLLIVRTDAGLADDGQPMRRGVALHTDRSHARACHDASAQRVVL